MTSFNRLSSFIPIFKKSFFMIKSDPLIFIPCVFFQLVLGIFLNFFKSFYSVDQLSSFQFSAEFVIYIIVFFILYCFSVLLLNSMLFFKKSNSDGDYTLNELLVKTFTTLPLLIYSLIIIDVCIFIFFLILSLLNVSFFSTLGAIVVLFSFFIFHSFIPTYVLINKQSSIRLIVAFIEVLKLNKRAFLLWSSCYVFIWFFKFYVLILFSFLNPVFLTTVTSFISGVLDTFVFTFTFLFLVELLKYTFDKHDTGSYSIK